MIKAMIAWVLLVILTLYTYYENIGSFTLEYLWILPLIPTIVLTAFIITHLKNKKNDLTNPN